MTIHDSPRLITVDDFSIGQRLDNYLIKQLKGVPKSRIYRIIRKGEVRVNKGRKKADYKLKAKDVIRIPPIRTSTEKEIKPSKELLKLLESSILYEDKGLLVMNKKHGMSVHGGSGISIGIIMPVLLNPDVQHIPVKLIYFDQSVNVTLGVPSIRTSVDHGTAFDIAYQNKADYWNMLSAIFYAYKMSKIKSFKALL